METSAIIFEDFIKKQHLKKTPQRILIADVFFKSQGHLSVEDLYDQVKIVDHSVGQATVYRTLKLLCEAKLAKEVHFGDGVARYEHQDGAHHHDHLICSQCGKNIEVLDENIERLQEELAQRYDFRLTSHRMYLYGLCSQCQKA